MPKKKSPSKSAAVLGPGLHCAIIELASDRGSSAGGARLDRELHVRTLDGRRWNAKLADEVDPAFAATCLKERRTVLLVDSANGPVVLGALQTSEPVTREANGAVTVRGKDVHVRAERTLVLEAGPVLLRAESDGEVRFEGNRLVIDMSALVRLLSARVELP